MFHAKEIESRISTSSIQFLTRLHWNEKWALEGSYLISGNVWCSPVTRCSPSRNRVLSRLGDLLVHRWRHALMFSAPGCWLWECGWCKIKICFATLRAHPNAPIPFPVMSCGMPVPPVNGSIVGQDFSLGAKATYRCNPGFRLSGPITTSVICQESGRWSPIEAPLRCVREYLSYCQTRTRTK